MRRDDLMKYPDKWRDTIDPFNLPYKVFKPLEIIGYPHAGNDVFYVKGIVDNKEIFAFVKAARQNDANIANEVFILSQFNLELIKR